MKPWIFGTVLLFISASSFAQSDSLEAASLRFPTIPPFTLIKVDSTEMTRNDIHKNRQTMIMYFSPECSHCQHQTEDMLAEMDKLKNTEIVMVTYEKFEDMTAFYEKYQIAKYPNIKMGRDTKFFFVPFYRMQNLPYMALYDKKGNLITTFEGNHKIDKLAKAFSKSGTE